MSEKEKLTPVQRFLYTNQKLLSTSQTISDIYNATMERDPRATAFIYFDENGKKRKISYAQWKNDVFTTASKLSTAFSGIPAGTVVGIKLKNSRFWPVFFYAILMSGHSPLLLNASLPVANTNNLLAQAKAKALICNEDGEFSVPSFRVNDILSMEANYRFTPDWADHIIFCSSGTTGDAKLAVYRGKNLVHQILASTDMWKENDDIMYPGRNNLRIFAMLPFHHVFGLLANFFWYTFYGKTLVFPSSAATKDLLGACQKGKVTHVYSVPLFWDSVAQAVMRSASSQGPKKAQLIDKMIAYNTHKINKEEAGLGGKKLIQKIAQKKVLGSHIRFCISGGGYLSPKTATIINGIGYPLYNGYGMTEVGITSVELSTDVERRLQCSIGHPFYGVEYKIVPIGDKASSDEVETGELYIRSGIVHEKEFRGGALVRMNYEDGWFRTEDIAGRDEQGGYYIKGRTKDTIILANGENVYPDEIEDYFKGVAHVHNCVVLGVEPKGEKEELIALVIEVDNEMKAEDIPHLKSDVKAINDTLPAEKKVKKIYIDRKPLPISNAMKVKRVEVRKGLETGSNDFLDFDGQRKELSFEGYDPKKVASVLSVVTKVFSEVLLLPEFKIEPSADWGADLSGDSMSYIEMVQSIEAKFGLKIPDDQLGVLMTANDFTKMILDLQGKDK